MVCKLLGLLGHTDHQRLQEDGPHDPDNSPFTTDPYCSKPLQHQRERTSKGKVSLATEGSDITAVAVFDKGKHFLIGMFACLPICTPVHRSIYLSVCFAIHRCAAQHQLLAPLFPSVFSLSQSHLPLHSQAIAVALSSGTLIWAASLRAMREQDGTERQPSLSPCGSSSHHPPTSRHLLPTSHTPTSHHLTNALATLPGS